MKVIQTINSSLALIFLISKQTDTGGKTRRKYILVGSGAAIPAAHGLATGIGLPPSRKIYLIN